MKCMCNDYVIITFELSCQILVIKNYDVIDTSIIVGDVNNDKSLMRPLLVC